MKIPACLSNIVLDYIGQLIIVYDSGKLLTRNNLNDVKKPADVTEIFIRKLDITSNKIFQPFINLKLISGNPPLIKTGNLSMLFYNLSKLNFDPSEWNTNMVTDMSMMFFRARSFQGDISKWDTSNVTNTHAMFHGTDCFKSDLGNWDVSQIVDMSYMFSYAISFQSDISNWDTSNVKHMNFMFNNAKSFRINLSRWDIGEVVNTHGMFYNNAISYYHHHDYTPRKKEIKEIKERFPLHTVNRYTIGL